MRTFLIVIMYIVVALSILVLTVLFLLSPRNTDAQLSLLLGCLLGLAVCLNAAFNEDEYV